MTSQDYESGTINGVKYVKYGDHIDTVETVDAVFHEQRKLSFAYGFVFFAVTLAIPALTVTSEWWYAGTGKGFTPNWMVVSLLYYVFLWVMAWMYSKQADSLDERLNKMADKAEADLTAREGAQA